MGKIKELFIKHKQIILYAIFGVLTTLVNIATYWICYNLCKIKNVPSNIIAWFIAVVFAFVTNKVSVFNRKTWDKNTILETVYFFLGRIASGVLEVGMMYLFVDVLHLQELLFKTITTIIVIIINYFFSKFIVFKDRKNNKVEETPNQEISTESLQEEINVDNVENEGNEE